MQEKHGNVRTTVPKDERIEDHVQQMFKQASLQPDERIENSAARYVSSFLVQWTLETRDLTLEDAEVLSEAYKSVHNTIDKNIEYVNTLTTSISAQAKVLSVMAKYKDDRWWVSDDLYYVGQMQLHEDTQIISNKKYQDGLELYLGRSIEVTDLTELGILGLRNEARLKRDFGKN